MTECERIMSLFYLKSTISNNSLEIDSRYWLPLWDLLCTWLKLKPIIRYKGNAGNLKVSANLRYKILSVLYDKIHTRQIDAIEKYYVRAEVCYLCNGKKCAFCKHTGTTPRRSIRRYPTIDIYNFCFMNPEFVVTKTYNNPPSPKAFH